MPDAAPANPGLFASARGLVATGAALAANRLALLGVEISEGGARLLSLLLYGGMALLCLFAALLFFAILVTVALWDSNRLLALGMFGALFLGAGLVSVWVLRRLLRESATVFSATLAELQRDREALRGRHDSR